MFPSQPCSELFFEPTPFHSGPVIHFTGGKNLTHGIDIFIGDAAEIAVNGA